MTYLSKSSLSQEKGGLLAGGAAVFAHVVYEAVYPAGVSADIQPGELLAHEAFWRKLVAYDGDTSGLERWAQQVDLGDEPHADKQGVAGEMVKAPGAVLVWCM